MAQPYTQLGIRLLVLPGIEAMGLLPTVVLCDSPEALRTMRVSTSTTHTVFALSHSPPTEEVNPEAEQNPDGAAGVLDPEIEVHALMIRPQASSRCSRLWRSSPNAEWTSDPPTSKSGVWAVLSFTRAPRMGIRAHNITACLLRWIAFAGANPDRVITERDAVAAGNAAHFITACAGSQRSASASHLRRSAALFRSLSISDAFDSLRHAVVARMELTPALRASLLRPESIPLSGTDRRELIYLARAGASELKVLAMLRLASQLDRDHPDVQNTLKQLQFSSHAWVRSAALISLKSPPDSSGPV